ncbi:hypothetical protein N7490_006762 [Penicillium lividum]|nr:hypothetical protein N7490_006762 [Penicillium lividum]
MTEKRASQLGPLSASITDLQAYHAENDTASKGLSDSTETTMISALLDEKGTKSISQNSIFHLQFIS